MTAIEAPAAAASIRLLLVEDELRDAELLRALLGNSGSPGFAISHVSTIERACSYVSERPVDVILLDLGLPDSRELEGLVRLHERVPEIPIIVLTGRAEEEVAATAIQSGAEDYLVKGYVDRRTLLRSIRYAIERHRSVRELARVTRELQAVNHTLERLILLDPLTDLLNRRGLQQAVSREIAHIEHGVEAVVVLIDIDDFKRVNDSLGHSVGDIALMEIARKLKAGIRSVDYAARVGGDEFILLLPDVSRAEVVRIAERARLAIATTTIQHSVGTLKLTASMAVMMLSTDIPSIDQVLAKAHQLLLRDKRHVKNRIAYEQGEFEDTDKRRRATSDLCSHLSQGKNLHTVKQPILRLVDERPVAIEFLSRYANGIAEMPDNFFRICSERNILTLVDHHCLRRAVAASAELSPHLRFHVNLFPSTMISIPPEHLLETFPHAMTPGKFCVEISEQQIIGDPTYLLPPVRAMRDAGILIAIDDVGFGNSCLESLVILEPDIIKIDKRCVIGLGDDKSRIQYLQRYLTLARTLGAEIVAEGIEGQAELSVMRDLGVEYGQGFLWGQPS